MNLCLLPLTVCSVTAASTQAGIAWDAGLRFMVAGIDGYNFAISEGDPSGSLDASYMVERPRGNTAVKASNVFRIEDDIYKSTSYFQVRTEHPTVDIEIGGSFLTSDASLTVSQRTTLRIDHRLTGLFTQRDGIRIVLTNESDDSSVFSLLAPPTTDYSLVTLMPGQYHLSEYYEISGTIMPEPRNRHFATHLALTVVPAPAALALLAPAGLLAARRKR